MKTDSAALTTTASLVYKAGGQALRLLRLTPDAVILIGDSADACTFPLSANEDFYGYMSQAGETLYAKTQTGTGNVKYTVMAADEAHS